MWFKELSDHSGLINQVAEIRPLLKKHYEALGRIISKAEYSMLHYRYSLTLKQITIKSKFRLKPTSLRLLESDTNGPIALHEASLSKKNPKLLETFLSQTYILNFQKAISKIREIDKDETKGVIRLLSIPSINVEAVWLYNKEADVNLFANIWEFGFKDRKVYSENEFLAFINEFKSRLGKIKGELGA